MGPSAREVAQRASSRDEQNDERVAEGADFLVKEHGECTTPGDEFLWVDFKEERDVDWKDKEPSWPDWVSKKEWEMGRKWCWCWHGDKSFVDNWQKVLDGLWTQGQWLDIVKEEKETGEWSFTITS